MYNDPKLNSPLQTKRIKEYLPGYVGVHSIIGIEYLGFFAARSVGRVHEKQAKRQH